MSDPARREFLRWIAGSPLYLPALLSTLAGNRLWGLESPASADNVLDFEEHARGILDQALAGQTRNGRGADG